MKSGEAIQHLKLRAKQWENTPDSDPVVLLAVINEAIRQIAMRLRTCHTCWTNADAITAPTSESDVLRQVVISVDTTSGSTYEAPNKTYLAADVCTFKVSATDSRQLVEVPYSKVLHHPQALMESARTNSYPTSFAVVPRSRFGFNIHVWPAQNGIDAGDLSIWYWYIPGPLTDKANQWLEITDEHVDLIWPYALSVLTDSDTKRQRYLAQFEQMIRDHKTRAQTEARVSIEPLTGL